MINKVALVTGSSQGLGFGIVKELLKRKVKNVYLTAMTEQLGRDAVKKINNVGFNPNFHILDVTNSKSVKECADNVKQKHGTLDILVNNAGVTTEKWDKTTYDDSFRVLNTNYYGVLNVQDHFFPILNQDARVINISSNCGHISNLRNEYWIARLTNKDLDESDVNAFVDWFLVTVKNGAINPEDFYQTEILAYRVSKIALSALTIAQQRKIDRNISINSIHPGFVKTAMTNGIGFLTEEKASRAPVFLALDADQSIKGQYLWPHKRDLVEAMDWGNPDLPLYCDHEVFRQFEKK